LRVQITTEINGGWAGTPEECAGGGSEFHADTNASSSAPSIRLSAMSISKKATGRRSRRTKSRAVP
jgi:hypothetical protein